MLIIKRGYHRKYQDGGSGIFLKLKDLLSKFISKKQVADTKSSLPVGYRMVQCDSIPVQKQEISPGDCRLNQPRRNLAG